MTYRLADRPRVKKSTRRDVRIKRASVRKEVTPHIVDPIRLYHYESEMLLRILAKWLCKRGYAPRLKEFCKSKMLREGACAKYFEDLEASGLLLRLPSGGYMPTQAGFDSIHVVPVEPRFPTDPRERRALKREARDLARKLKTLDPVMKELAGI